MKLIIANKNYSSWSLRPWLALKVVGQPFETHRIVLDQPDTKANILQFSPHGKVPCLLDGQHVVWESIAILEYLAERFPQLWPREVQARAVARSVAAEMHAGFANLRSKMPMNIRARLSHIGQTIGRLPEMRADLARIEAIWNDCRTRFGAAGPYLFGEFTNADAMFAPVCFRFATYGIAMSGRAGEYLATMLAMSQMNEWAADARVEKEVVPSDEPYADMR